MLWLGGSLRGIAGRGGRGAHGSELLGPFVLGAHVGAGIGAARGGAAACVLRPLAQPAAAAAPGALVPTEAAYADEDTALQEVVVTAQKRSESAQAVPVSMQVVSSDTIAKQNQTSLEEIGETLPGLHIVARSNSNAASGASPNFDPA